MSEFARQAWIGRASSCWQACSLVYGGSESGLKINAATDPGRNLASANSQAATLFS